MIAFYSWLCGPDSTVKVISKLIISDFSYLRYHSIDSKNKE